MSRVSSRKSESQKLCCLRIRTRLIGDVGKKDGKESGVCAEDFLRSPPTREEMKVNAQNAWKELAG